jgi:hypothetical protein
MNINSIESKKDLTKRMNDFGFFASDLLQEIEPDKILFENDGVFVRFSHWEEVEQWLNANYITMEEANMSGKRMVTCVECGKVFEIGSCIELDGKYICEDCIDEFYVECEYCGEYVRKDKATYVDSEYGYICDDCLDSNYFQCDECGGYFRNEDDCGASNLPLCEGCYNDMFTTCERCGDVILMEDSFSDGCGNYYCETCWYERGGDISQYVREYHDSPDFIKKGYPKNNRFFGIEQETDYYDDIVKAAEELYELSDNENKFWMGNDGSLDEGIEIITHPMSLGYALEEYPWEEIHNIVMESGGSAHNNSTCGMHVHVSKDSLGDNDDEIAATVSKMLYLMEKHWDEWVKFSRRGKHSMERWCQKNEDTRLEEIDTKEKCVEKYNKEKCNGRYHAINCTNRETIEFRIFKGTLNTNTIKATLQMLNNFCEICMSTPIEEIQGVNFKDYACGTPEIEKYMKEREL